MTSETLPVRPADVAEAAARLTGVTHRTPVLTSRTLDARIGGHLHLKAECFQRTGAFKLRGAYNAIHQLPAQRRKRGVVSFSSGNHAQAVALAARLLGCAATIVMPEDAPAGKVAATRGYGAEVLTYDRYGEDRRAIAEELADERGATLIPPFDHPDIVAGQGTAARELLEEVDDLEVLVVPVGGGGLIAGSALAAAGRGVEVVGVEPADRHVAREALATGEVVRGGVPHTIADGQQTPEVGEIPCAVMARHVAAVVGVTDVALVSAMRLAFERLKIVIEPSGAAALAAILAGDVAVEGRVVGVIISGGNVDAERFAGLMRGDGAGQPSRVSSSSR